MNDMVVVCSWCADSVQRTAEAERSGRRVTHGMCRTCHLEALREVLAEHAERTARRAVVEAA